MRLLACAIMSGSASPLRTMLHPAAAKRSAAAKPSPPTDPVMSAHLPLSIWRCGYQPRFLFLRVERHRRSPILTGAHRAFRKNLMLPNPLERFLVRLLRIRFKYDPFTRPPSPRVHLICKPRRKLFLIVMRIALGVQIDIPLRSSQPPEILLHIFRIGIARDHRRNHKSRVDD